jgi:UDPglucose 6-dehydrogenase
MKPDRVVIGVEDPRAETIMRELYAPFQRNLERTVVMSIRSAELTKYAANAMLATRISFMNELSRLAEVIGADIESVRNGIGSDPRIGRSFLYAGTGYGGSCFPKDVKALAASFREVGLEPKLLDSVEAVNKRQKSVLFEKAQKVYGNLAGKRFALWGLAFKPNTDDMREAPSITLIEALLKAGATVKAYDPVATKEAQKVFSARPELQFVNSRDKAVEDSDALFIVTEWKEFRAPHFETLAAQLKDKLIFDGRNLYSPKVVESFGLSYHSIGRVQTKA